LEDGIGEVKAVPFTESDMAFATEKKVRLHQEKRQESEKILDSLLDKVTI